MKNERDFRWALVGTAGFSLLGYVIHAYTPDMPLLIFVFFTIVAITIFGWVYFIIPVKRVAILTTSFFLSFLLLRLFQLRHPLYIILLLLFFISLEVLRNKR